MRGPHQTQRKVSQAALKKSEKITFKFSIKKTDEKAYKMSTNS